MHEHGLFHVKQAFDATDFATTIAAPAGDIERLQSLLALLQRWQPRINLVGASTLADAWRRHILDSAQLVPLLPAGCLRVLDLGSGAGFPGLVLAILSSARVTLIESDARKCAFLAEAARHTNTVVDIVNARIESLAPQSADVVTARALAPLPILCEFAAKHMADNGFCLFLKGRNAAGELTTAKQNWRMRATMLPSCSDPSGVIVKIEELRRRDDC